MKWLCSRKRNRDIKYEAEVQRYFYKNIYNIIDGIQKLPIIDNIDFKDLIKIVGNDFPRYYRYKNNDKKQIEKFFRTLKIDIKTNKKCNYLREIFKDYSIAVKNYLLFSGSGTITNLCNCLEDMGNIVSYKNILNILGDHFPKLWIVKGCDSRIAAIFFLYETGFVFKYDSKFVYFA